MSDVARAFADTYAAARALFLAAAQARKAELTEHAHPQARGPAGEALAIDVARVGRLGAANLLVVTSGTHGVEGFCGSGIQVALLEDPAFLAALTRCDVEVALVHAVNPYGFAHLRRTNEHNVDLNRNFRDFAAPIARNAAYAEVHGFIVPTTWPPGPDTEQRLGAYLAQRGPAALQAAVTGGQYEFAEGLFYGGSEPAWSNVTLREFFRAHGAARKRIGWIDVHTGLGPAGHGEKIYSGPDDAAMLARTRAWFGADVTSFYTGTSASTEVSGSVSAAAVESCPGVEYAGIGLEFGTVPLEHTLQALRADQWLANHPDAPEPQRAAIKRALRDAFYVDTDAWKAMVYGQARVAVFQALGGLRL
ncbi:MAG TPA: M14 family metallopeptidase [Casimicrobiaceae bacterium]|jgi:hypothetical protein